MKKLLLCRHAKSAWDNPFLIDHKRPLSPRGMDNAPLMAQRLKSKSILPDKIISSDAKRAESTALIIAEILGFPINKIHFTSKLYHASAASILSVIKDTPDHVETLFLFGHNPGLNDLIELLDGEIDNLPTCGQLGFIFESDTWKAIHRSNAKFWFLDYPKNSK
jgi:phosphohistidine phosphatase